jgi:EAL domain-containing protein (putative c-di-GMP-specific phosphodiesterase class I)
LPVLSVDSHNINNRTSADGTAASADGLASVDIPRLLHESGIQTHFQPITSIRKQSIIGVEALSRGFVDGAQVPPLTLFQCAEQENLAFDLDCLCRETAIQTFRPLFSANRNLILFLNFHALSVQGAVDGRCDILDLVQQLDLDPRNVVIEILENEFRDAKRYVARWKATSDMVFSWRWMTLGPDTPISIASRSSNRTC